MVWFSPSVSLFLPANEIRIKRGQRWSVMMIIVPISAQWHEASSGIFTAVRKQGGRVRMESVGEWMRTLCTQHLIPSSLLPAWLDCSSALRVAEQASILAAG